MSAHRRCCDDPENLRESDHGATVLLLCIVCGTVLAESDDRGELFADY